MTEYREIHKNGHFFSDHCSFWPRFVKLVPKTGSTQGIRIWSRKLRFLNITDNFREIKNLKSTKMGRSKKLEKLREAISIKNASKYVYNLISYRWIQIWNQFLGVFVTYGSNWTLKRLIFRFFYFSRFIPWFEAFTIQKRQIKLKIRNSLPKISTYYLKNCW